MITPTYQTLTTGTDLFGVRLNPATGFKGLFSNQSFDEGEELFTFSVRSLHQKPTYLTVQIDEKTHFEFEPEFLQYMNHHCDPNVHLDLNNFTLVALKPIREGEELHFFYPSTEWKMDRPFACHCGSKKCIGIISGAYALSTTQLANYQLSPYIQQKLGN
ncbi:MAG: SET domain-containing protein [Bacteroidetes bacterium]|nr:SET domain-containing protein [Bacteroidota bacterium]